MLRNMYVHRDHWKSYRRITEVSQVLITTHQKNAAFLDILKNKKWSSHLITKIII